MTHTRRLRRLASQRGQALVEFTIVLPLLLMVFFAITTISQIWDRQTSLNDAVRAETRQAIVCRFTTSPTPQQVFSNTVGGRLPGITTPDPVYNAGSCQQGTQVTVTGTYPWNITILGITFGSGTLTSSSTGSVE
jgi:Flp pilus assembly protein TadG